MTGNWTKESGRHSGTTLTDAVVRAGSDGQRSSSGKRLNPRFVEWMIGMPENWATLPSNLRGPGAWADEIHAIGNSVVRQAAEVALRILIKRAAC